MYCYYENNEKYEVFKEYEEHGRRFLILLNLGEDSKYVDLKDCKRTFNKEYKQMRELEELYKQQGTSKNNLYGCLNLPISIFCPQGILRKLFLVSFPR